jgi:hypothetical protein
MVSFCPPLFKVTNHILQPDGAAILERFFKLVGLVLSIRANSHSDQHGGYHYGNGNMFYDFGVHSGILKKRKNKVNNYLHKIKNILT